MDMMDSPRDATGETMLTKKDLARRWDCSIKSVERLVASRVLLPTRIGRRLVRFRREDILAAEKKMRSVCPVLIVIVFPCLLFVNTCIL